jgi:histidinol-phosphate aminotransferase
MQTAARFASFPPYTPIEPFEVLSARLGRPPEQIVKLDANENPFGPSPLVRQALAELEFPHIYPDPESRALRQGLAAFTGLPVENLLAGAGADELIDLLLRVLLEPGDCVINCPPTFGMYPFDTLLNTGQVIDVPRRPDFSLDLPAIQAAVEARRPKAIFITTPNNPDGNMPAAEEIDFLLALPVLVVLDEAYIEFTRAGGRLGEKLTRLTEVPQRENLVVLRTFSKWAGLAGLRVGYGAFTNWLLPALWKAKQPYNVNVAASAAALASLRDLDYLAGNVERLRQERERLYQMLVGVPSLRPFPSQANFILCQVSGRPAKDLKNALAQEGVLVRYYNNALLQDFIRVSVGRPQDTDALQAALAKVQPGSAPDGIRQPVPVTGQPKPTAPAAAAGDEAQPAASLRRASLIRQTGETQVEVRLDIDGTGKHQVETGLPFLDHMLVQVAVHGLFDLYVQAKGDLHIDPHHTLEDVALTLGSAFQQALGDRAGIQRMASADCPMDESLAWAAVDFSGRPYCVFQVEWHGPEVGGLPVSLFAHFFESFALNARCNLHAAVRYGRDDHHQAEALFKALGRSLCAATRSDPRRAGQVPSSKGVLF